MFQRVEKRVINKLLEENNQTEAKPSREAIPRHNVLGVGISSIDLEQGEANLYKAAEDPGFVGYVTITGVHGVMESQGNEELKKIHNNSYMSTPDGMPMVWLGKWSGAEQVERVYGPDLMYNVMQNSQEHGVRHFFFGGADGVAQKLEGVFASVSDVVGVYTPPFRPLTEQEELNLLEQFQETRPHCVWVGLSTPKQENFMASFIAKYGNQLRFDDQGVVFIGVGAAFDFHTGAVKQAPKWIQKSGFEWFFRVCMEPRRLWKRYAVNNSRFIVKILVQMMGLKQYELKK